MDKAFTGIQEQVNRGIAILRSGGVVAFPTDTVYGLGASSNLPEAIEKVFQIKERPHEMALPLLLADESQVPSVAQSVPHIARLLISSFLPGALTLVMLKSSSVSDIITAGGNTVAIRIPAHPIPVALAAGLGIPIVGTSANTSGKPSPMTAGDVRSQLGDKVDLIIDGGRCPGGKESTIVDVTGLKPVLLREGAISRAEIEKVCGNIFSAE